MLQIELYKLIYTYKIQCKYIIRVPITVQIAKPFLNYIIAYGNIITNVKFNYFLGKINKYKLSHKFFAQNDTQELFSKKKRGKNKNGFEIDYYVHFLNLI